MNIEEDDWTLVYKESGLPVSAGDRHMSFRGNEATIFTGRPPHKPSSEGFVYTSDSREFYPSVFSLAWRRDV